MNLTYWAVLKELTQSPQKMYSVLINITVKKKLSSLTCMQDKLMRNELCTNEKRALLAKTLQSCRAKKTETVA